MTSTLFCLGCFVGCLIAAALCWISVVLHVRLFRMIRKATFQCMDSMARVGAILDKLLPIKKD